MANNVNNNVSVELHYGLPAQEDKIRVEEHAVVRGLKGAGVLTTIAVAAPTVGVIGTVFGGIGYAIFSSNRRNTHKVVANAWKSACNGLFDKTFYDKRTVATDGPWAERSVRENPDNHLSPLGVMPGDEDGIKNLFDTTNKTIYTDNTNSHVQYIINADEGRVYLKIAKDDGTHSYQSFKVVNPSNGDMIQETARLMKAAKTIAAALNDPKANGCFDRYDMVVVHIKYHDTQHSLVMRGFKYACWKKNEQTDEIEWDPKAPLWNVDPSSILYGAEIQSEKALTKEIARIFGLDDKGKLQDDLRDRKPGAAGAAGPKGAGKVGKIPFAPPPYVPAGFTLIKIPTDNQDKDYDMLGAFAAQDMLQGDHRDAILQAKSIPNDLQPELLARIHQKKMAVAEFMQQRIQRLIQHCDQKDVPNIIAKEISQIKTSLQEELRRRWNGPQRRPVYGCEREYDRIQSMLNVINQHKLTDVKKAQEIEKIGSLIVTLYEKYAFLLAQPSTQFLQDDKATNPIYDQFKLHSSRIRSLLMNENGNAQEIADCIRTLMLKDLLDVLHLHLNTNPSNAKELLDLIKYITHMKYEQISQQVTVRDEITEALNLADLLLNPPSIVVPVGFWGGALCQEYLVRMYEGSVLQYNCTQSADFAHRKAQAGAGNEPLYLHYEKGSHYDLLVRVAPPQGRGNGPDRGNGSQVVRDSDGSQGGRDRGNDGRKVRRSQSEDFGRRSHGIDGQGNNHGLGPMERDGTFSSSSERQRQEKSPSSSLDSSQKEILEQLRSDVQREKEASSRSADTTMGNSHADGTRHRHNPRSRSMSDGGQGTQRNSNAFTQAGVQSNAAAQPWSALPSSQQQHLENQHQHQQILAMELEATQKTLQNLQALKSEGPQAQQLENNNDELEQLRKRIAELEGLLRTEQGKNSALEQTLTSKSGAILRLGAEQRGDWEKISKLEAEKVQLEEGREEYRVRNQELIQKWEEALQDLASKKAELETLSRELAEAKNSPKNEANDDEVRRLQSKLDRTLRYAKKRVHDISAELQSSANRRKTLDAALTIEREIRDLKDMRIEELQEELARVQAELQSEIDLRRQENSELTKLKDRAIEGWQATLKELASKQSELALERDSYKKGVGALQGLLESLKSSQEAYLEKQRLEHAAKEEKLRAASALAQMSLERENAQNKSQFDALRADVATKEESLTVAIAQKVAAEKEQQVLSQQIEKLTADLSKAQTDANIARERSLLEQEKIRGQLELAHKAKDTFQLEFQKAFKAEVQSQQTIASLQQRVTNAEAALQQKQTANKEQIRTIIRETRTDIAKKEEALQKATAEKEAIEEQKRGADLAIQELQKALREKQALEQQKKQVDAEVADLRLQLLKQKAEHASQIAALHNEKAQMAEKLENVLRKTALKQEGRLEDAHQEYAVKENLLQIEQEKDQVHV